jgi:hypothetical protein
MRSIYQIEILGPTGEVHYRRPIDHQMVRDALTTPGYAVRWPGCRDMRKLNDLPQNCKAEVTFPVEGMTAACPNSDATKTAAAGKPVGYWQRRGE